MQGSWSKAVDALVCFVALVLCMPIATMALEKSEEDVTAVACADGETLIDPADMFRDDYSESFNLYISWDMADSTLAPATWSYVELREFIDAVMPDYVDENTPDTAIAHRTAQYFGNDDAEEYELIWLTRPNSPGSVWKTFDIVLEKVTGSPQSNASERCVRLQFNDWSVDPELLAIDHFAHEFGHVANYSIWPCISWGASVIGEFIPMSSEYYNGHYDDDISDDSRYSKSMSGYDWSYNCLGHDNADRRDLFRPFTLYLQEHFANTSALTTDDLLHKWIRGENCSAPRKGPHDWNRLAEKCEDEEFDEEFSSESGDDRLRELFQEWALAMWVNYSLPGVGTGAVYSPSDSKKPQDYRFFSGANYGGVWVYDDAMSLPLYNTVTTTKQYKRDIISYLDFDANATPDDSLLCNNSRPVALESYGMLVLPFVIDDALSSDDEGYNLHIEFVAQDSIFCHCDKLAGC